MRRFSCKRIMTAIVSAGLIFFIGMGNSIAQEYHSVDYYPLGVGNTWDYTVTRYELVGEEWTQTDTWSETRTVLSGTMPINGTETAVVEYVWGRKDFYTNDSESGLLYYGYYLPEYHIGEGTPVDCDAKLTITFDPPIQIAKPSMVLGDDPIVSTGDATFAFAVGCPYPGLPVSDTVPYTATATIGTATERTTVPLGTFSTIKIDTVISTGPVQISGFVVPVPVITQTDHLAKNVGNVKFVIEVEDDRWNYELTGTSLPVRRPMPWIPLLLLGD